MDYLQIDRSRRKSTDLVINPWILLIHELAVTDPVKFWFPLILVLRNFRELLSAYVVYIKPFLEIRIPIYLGQVEFSTRRTILIIIYLSLSFTKLFSSRSFSSLAKRFLYSNNFIFNYRD
jgi:hypothetical protein